MRDLFKFHLKSRTKIFTILLFSLTFHTGKSQPVDQFESTEWMNPFKPDEVDKAIESGIQFLLSTVLVSGQVSKDFIACVISAQNGFDRFSEGGDESPIIDIR